MLFRRCQTRWIWIGLGQWFLAFVIVIVVTVGILRLFVGVSVCIRIVYNGDVCDCGERHSELHRPHSRSLR